MNYAPQIAAFTLSLITGWAFLAPAPSQPPQASFPPQSAWTTRATVTKVVDGDTLDVELKRTIRIRLIDCWAPESILDQRVPEAERAAAKQAGIASKAHLTLLAHGKPVIVQIPTDPDGTVSKSITLNRVLGNVWLLDDQESLSEKQVASGFATKGR